MFDGRWSVIAGVCVALAMAFAVGFYSGRASLPAQVVAPAVQANGALAAVAPTGASAGAPDAQADAVPRAAAATLELSSLPAWVTDAIESRSVPEIARLWGGDPKAAIATIIGQLSDEQLVAAVSSLSDFAGRDIARRKDKRGYVARLSEIALDGIATEATPGSGLMAVEFTTKVDEAHSATNAREVFGAEDEKIYAVFENLEVPQGQVLVKWTRTDNPELMLLEKYPINRRNDHSYVWFEPSEGFPPGDYQVDFYSSRGDMDHLGTGSYQVGQ